jgi:hypothetical protein
MPKEKLFVDPSAHVYCPLRGRTVDIELCLACGRLEDLDLDSRRPSLLCRGPDRAERDARVYRAAGMA